MERRFGIEIECYGIPKNTIIDLFKNNNIPVLRRTDYSHAVSDCWKVVRDSSIDGDNSAEVVSPPLKPTPENFELVAKVYKILKDGGAKVNKSCGLHVHVDMTDIKDGKYVVALMQRYLSNEKSIDELVLSDRRKSNNRFCMSMSYQKELNEELLVHTNKNSRITESYFQDYFTRYIKLNPHAYVRQKTIEFRHFHGTMNSKKAIAWIKFCINFVESTIENIEAFKPEKNHFIETVVEKAMSETITQADFSPFKAEKSKDFFQVLLEDYNSGKLKLDQGYRYRDSYYTKSKLYVDTFSTDAVFSYFIAKTSPLGVSTPKTNPVLFAQNFLTKENFLNDESLFVDSDNNVVYKNKILLSLLNLEFLNKGKHAKKFREIYCYYCFLQYWHLFYQIGKINMMKLDCSLMWKTFFGTKKQGKLKLSSVLDLLAKEYGYKNAIEAGQAINESCKQTNMLLNNVEKIISGLLMKPNEYDTAATTDGKISFSRRSCCLPITFFKVIIQLFPHVFRQNQNIETLYTMYFDRLLSNRTPNFHLKTVEFCLENKFFQKQEESLFDLMFNNSKPKNIFTQLFDIVVEEKISTQLFQKNMKTEKIILKNEEKWFDAFIGLDKESIDMLQLPVTIQE